MKSIFEEYGDAILQAVGAIAILAVIIDLLRGGGTLHQLISSLAEGAC